MIFCHFYRGAFSLGTDSSAPTYSQKLLPSSFCRSFYALSGSGGPESNELADFEQFLPEGCPGHGFASGQLQANSLCRRITLRAKGSTRNLGIRGEAPLQVLSPRQSRKNQQDACREHFFKISMTFGIDDFFVIFCDFLGLGSR